VRALLVAGMVLSAIVGMMAVLLAISAATLKRWRPLEPGERLERLRALTKDGRP